MSVKVEDQDVIISTGKATTIDVKDTSIVKAHPRDYKIVGNDVYVIKRNDDPDQWFLDMLDNEINTSTLSQDVSDLNTRFDNYSDGVTLEIGQIKDDNLNLAYTVDTLKSSSDTHTAGIQDLRITKVDAEGAEAIARTVIGAWETSGASAAWFDQKISTVSTTANAAAKSASTLTASINSQKDRLTALAGDFETLSKQVDGVVETWFDTHDIVTVNQTTGAITINLSAEPYASWLSDNKRSIHTGDTYIKYELDVDGNKNYISSYRFVKSTIDEPTTDSEGYTWVPVVDSKAEEAFQSALNAQETADKKINTFYQTYPPTVADNNTLGLGDLWVDSDDDNKLYRYQGNPLDWVLVTDTRVQASVDRLDEATVDVDGTARAKSSLIVNANNVVSGFVADSGTSSSFKIFADKFSIVSTAGQNVGAPFTVDTTTNNIRFNGVVSFDNVDGNTDFASMNDLDGSNGTVISGSAIVSKSINADKITANSVWVNGVIRDSDFSSTLNYTTGFQLKANAAGNYSDPNVYGAYIRGGTVYGANVVGATITGSTINAKDFSVTTEANLSTDLILHTSGSNSYLSYDYLTPGHPLYYTHVKCSFNIHTYNSKNKPRVSLRSGNTAIISGITGLYKDYILLASLDKHVDGHTYVRVTFGSYDSGYILLESATQGYLSVSYNEKNIGGFVFVNTAVSSIDSGHICMKPKVILPIASGDAELTIYVKAPEISTSWMSGSVIPGIMVYNI